MGSSPPKPPTPSAPGPASVGQFDAVASIKTTGHVVTFKLQDAPPPSQLYISPDDQLLIEGISTVTGETLIVSWRTLGIDGYIHAGQQSIPLKTLNTFITQLIPLGEGFLLNLEISNSLTTTQRGQLFTTAFLWRGQNIAAGIETALLIQDYVDAFTMLGWPGGRIISSVEGPGCLRSIVGTQPAAGADIAETVPTGRRWQLQSFQAQLVTAVAVANRQVELLITDGTNTIFYDTVEAVQTASLTDNYCWADRKGSNQTAFQNGTLSRSLPFIELGPGWKIRTSTNLIAAADQWSAPVYSIKEWLML